MSTFTCDLALTEAAECQRRKERWFIYFHEYTKISPPSKIRPNPLFGMKVLRRVFFYPNYTHWSMLQYCKHVGSYSSCRMSRMGSWLGACGCATVDPPPIASCALLSSSSSERDGLTKKNFHCSCARITEWLSPRSGCHYRHALP